MPSRDARRAGYESPRHDVLARIPVDARRVLDLGCSSGVLGAALKERQRARVVGVDVDADLLSDARARLDRVEHMDAGSFVASNPGDERFDCIVCADVLEHLVDPWEVLRDAVTNLDPGGTVVVSVPNVLWFRNALRLLRERRWPREDAGIFDRTHLRWFALADAHDLLRSAGLQIEVTDFRYWNDRMWVLPVLERLSTTRLATFTAAQYIVTGRRPL